MFELATDFSKLTKVPQYFYIDQDMSDEEILKQAKFFIKQRILTNLDVPAWDTQFNYYTGEFYGRSDEIINDKYIRYEQIKIFLEFVEYVELREFEKIMIYSKFDHESHPYRSELDRYTERGSIGAGVWKFCLSPNYKLNNNLIVELILFPDCYFYTIIYISNASYSSENLDDFKKQYNKLRDKNILSNLET